MANFNTYQTRNFYVAGAIDSNLDTNGDIALKTTATGEFFFAYKNADGLLTRSDLIKPENISSLKKTEAADMDLQLQAHQITVDTTEVALSELAGKTVNLSVTLHQVLSYDDSDTLTYTASVVGNATNTASAAAFYKALAKAVVNAMPNLPEVPYKVYLVKSGSATEITKTTADGDYMADATSLVIVQAQQRWSRGKMSNDPYGISVAFNLHGSNTEGIVWGTDSVKLAKDITGISPTAIPSAYALADLEYFALGERGDVYRGSIWPNNYDPTYMIDVSKEYNVLTIEFFWQGTAENVQKSPRMIQICAEAAMSDDVVTTLYDEVEAIMAGMASS